MKISLLLCSLLMTATIAFSQEKELIKVYGDKENSSISYSMNHPLHSWTGISKEISSIILTDNKKKEINQVAVAVKISTFDSQNANRDSHAMESTEALKFPTISFSSNSILIDGDILNVSGTLSFHGISKAINFKANKKKIKDKIEVSGNFIIRMTEFEIDPPTLMGMATDDTIKISFDMVY